jgi:hypothetical protein
MNKLICDRFFDESHFPPSDKKFLINDLPTELFEKILSNLGRNDIKSFVQVSYFWNQKALTFSRNSVFLFLQSFENFLFK